MSSIDALQNLLLSSRYMQACTLIRMFMNTIRAVCAMLLHMQLGSSPHEMCACSDVREVQVACRGCSGTWHLRC